MTHNIPRYEYRIFGLKELEEPIHRLSSQGEAGEIRHIAEIYLMTAGNTENNVKIRNKRLDIKTLVRQAEGLEQWNPREIGEFPLKSELIRNEIFPALGVESPLLERPQYSLKQFMQELVLDDPDILVALTVKERHAYHFMQCICEYAAVQVNGALVHTLAVESERPAQVQQAVKALQIDRIENVNYPKAIKRILGLEINFNLNKYF